MSEGKILGREDILGAKDLHLERVHCPEWGGDVYVRTMGGDERDAYELGELASRDAAKTPTDRKGLRARLCALTMCDAEGRRLFSPEDVEALGSKSARALDRVFDAAKRTNGIGEADIEALEGNSVAGLNGVSGSVSR